MSSKNGQSSNGRQSSKTARQNNVYAKVYADFMSSLMNGGDDDEDPTGDDRNRRLGRSAVRWCGEREPRLV